MLTYNPIFCWQVHHLCCTIVMIIRMKYNTTTTTLMVQLFNLSLCPQFKFTVKQQVNNKNVYFFQYELLEISTNLPEPQNLQMQNILLTKHKLNAIFLMWACYNLLLFKVWGCNFIHMDCPNSLGKSYVQQGQMPPQTKKMLTTVFVMPQYGCGRMHSINFMILILSADHGSRY